MIHIFFALCLCCVAYIVGYNQALEQLARKIDNGQQTIIEKSAHVARDVRSYKLRYHPF